jgi:hypothetical protein
MPELRVLMGEDALHRRTQQPPAKADRFNLIPLHVAAAAPSPSHIDIAATTLATHKADCTIAAARYKAGLDKFVLDAPLTPAPPSTRSVARFEPTSVRVRAPAASVKFSTETPRPPPRTPLQATAAATPSTPAPAALALQQELKSTSDYNAALRILVEQLQRLQPQALQAPFDGATEAAAAAVPLSTTKQPKDRTASSAPAPAAAPASSVRVGAFGVKKVARAEERDSGVRGSDAEHGHNPGAAFVPDFSAVMPLPLPPGVTQAASAGDVGSRPSSQSLAADAAVVWAMRRQQSKFRSAVVLYRFMGRASNNELSVAAGDRVLAKLSEKQRDWTFCYWDGRQGWVPTAYLRLLDEGLYTPSPPTKSGQRGDRTDWGEVSGTPGVGDGDAAGAVPPRGRAGTGGAAAAAAAAAAAGLRDGAPSSQQGGDPVFDGAHVTVDELAQLLRGAHETARHDPSSLSDFAGPGSPLIGHAMSAAAGLAEIEPGDTRDGVAGQLGGGGDNNTTAAAASASGTTPPPRLHRRQSTADQLSAALASVWMAGRVRGSDSLEAAAAAMHGASRGSTGAVVTAYPGREAPVLWQSTSSPTRGRHPMGHSVAVQAAVGQMLVGPRTGGSLASPRGTSYGYETGGFSNDGLGSDYGEGEDTTGRSAGDSARDSFGGDGSGRDAASGMVSPVRSPGGTGGLGRVAGSPLNRQNSAFLFSGSESARGGPGNSSSYGERASGRPEGSDAVVVGGESGAAGPHGDSAGLAYERRGGGDASAVAQGETGIRDGDWGSNSVPNVDTGPASSGPGTAGIAGLGFGTPTGSPEGSGGGLQSEGRGSDRFGGGGGNITGAGGEVEYGYPGESTALSDRLWNGPANGGNISGRGGPVDISVGTGGAGGDSSFNIFSSSAGDLSSRHSDEQPYADLSMRYAAPKPQLQADGSRVKIVAMNASELWSLLGPKVACVAMLTRAVKNARDARRFTKVAAFALLRRWVYVAVAHRRRAKVFALGVGRAILRRRKVDAVRARVAALGLLCRALRLQTREAAAQAAAKAKAAPHPNKAVPPPYSGPKLRALHWETVPEASVKGTIWDRSGRPKNSDADTAAALLPSLFTRFAEKAPAVAAEKSGGAAAAAALHGELPSMLNVEVRSCLLCVVRGEPLIAATHCI